MGSIGLMSGQSKRLSEVEMQLNWVNLQFEESSQDRNQLEDNLKQLQLDLQGYQNQIQQLNHIIKEYKIQILQSDKEFSRQLKDKDIQIMELEQQILDPPKHQHQEKLIQIKKQINLILKSPNQLQDFQDQLFSGRVNDLNSLNQNMLSMEQGLKDLQRTNVKLKLKNGKLYNEITRRERLDKYSQELQNNLKYKCDFITQLGDQIRQLSEQLLQQDQNFQEQLKSVNYQLREANQNILYLQNAEDSEFRKRDHNSNQGLIQLHNLFLNKVQLYLFKDYKQQLKQNELRQNLSDISNSSCRSRQEIQELFKKVNKLSIYTANYMSAKLDLIRLEHQNEQLSKSHPPQ